MRPIDREIRMTNRVIVIADDDVNRIGLVAANRHITASVDIGHSQIATPEVEWRAVGAAPTAGTRHRVLRLYSRNPLIPNRPRCDGLRALAPPRPVVLPPLRTIWRVNWRGCFGGPSQVSG
jgi:hypothetical protein